MPKPQSAQNHARTDLTHHPAMALLALNVLVTLVWAFVAHSPGLPLRMWVVLVALALCISSVKARTNALRAQDRIIRLEERLRLSSLLPAGSPAATPNLTEAQLVALRFAPDAELPSLAQRTREENLTPKQIKQAIENWRADHFRI